MDTSEADYYALRAEWLRFKSHLFDALTGLPALPAVMHDVGRVVEERGGADVVYLDLGRSGWQETKLGWATYDEALREFAALLGSLRHTGELDAQDIICLHTARSDRFLVFMGGGYAETPPGGLSSAFARRERLMSALRARVSALPAPNPLLSMHLAGGHARIPAQPSHPVERAIQQAVADARVMSLVEGEGIDVARRDELARLTLRGSVRTAFHPIVRLTDGGVIGHEALTRPLGRVSFESVEELFAFVETTELLREFERLCLRTAIRSAAAIEGLGMLFLNASARAVEDPEWSSGVMDELLAQSRLAPRDVVVEVTERVAIVRHDAFSGALRTFKERGYRVAVDDMGAGYASFQALADLEPEFLKCDVSLVRDVDRSSIKRSLLGSIRTLADRIRARVVAEGVEREEERRTLLSLGIELGQGYRFHREGLA